MQALGLLLLPGPSLSQEMRHTSFGVLSLVFLAHLWLSTAVGGADSTHRYLVRIPSGHGAGAQGLLQGRRGAKWGPVRGAGLVKARILGGPRFSKTKVDTGLCYRGRLLN